MANKLIIGLLMMQMFSFVPATIFPENLKRKYGCLEGKCAMENFRKKDSSSSSKFKYCWIDSDGKDLTCGGAKECREAAEGSGKCKASGSLAPDPQGVKGKSQTCENLNEKKVTTLKNECKDDTYHSWVKKYDTPWKLYTAFKPCQGPLIDEETKKVIKYCYCYNFCGETQAKADSCTYDGLDEPWDRDADTRTAYKAVCKIDCEPKEKFVEKSSQTNDLNREMTWTVTITKGMTSTRTKSTGGSESNAVSGEVGAKLFGTLLTKFGKAETAKYDWSQITASSDIKQLSHEITVTIPSKATATLFQLVGECKNKDGSVYNINTSTYKVTGTDDKEVKHLANDVY